MNWIRRKVFLYNVTFGLYMLDWWERYLFNILVIVLLWFILGNTSRFVTRFWQSFKVPNGDGTSIKLVETARLFLEFPDGLMSKV